METAHALSQLWEVALGDEPARRSTVTPEPEDRKLAAISATPAAPTPPSEVSAPGLLSSDELNEPILPTFLSFASAKTPTSDSWGRIAGSEAAPPTPPPAVTDAASQALHTVAAHATDVATTISNALRELREMQAPLYSHAQLQTPNLAGECVGLMGLKGLGEEEGEESPGMIGLDGTLMGNEDEIDTLLSSTDALLNGGAGDPNAAAVAAVATSPSAERASVTTQSAAAKIFGDGGLFSMASEYLSKRMLHLGTREYQNIEKECRRLHLLTPAEQDRLRSLRKRSRGKAGKQHRKSPAAKPLSPESKSYKETFMGMFAHLGPMLSG